VLKSSLVTTIQDKYGYSKKEEKDPQNSLTFLFSFSTMSDIGSPLPLVYLSDTEHEDSLEPQTPLYQSLVEAIKHPGSPLTPTSETIHIS
jgi:hypothetical protein